MEPTADALRHISLFAGLSDDALARVARRRGVSTSQVALLYQQAMSRAEARCRGVELAWILREGSNYLVTRATGQARARALDVARRAEEWLRARGISEYGEQGTT